MDYKNAIIEMLEDVSDVTILKIIYEILIRI